MDYAYPGGTSQCLRFFTEHVKLVHSPPYEDWEMCVTGGATIATEMALRLFCNPGDWVLVEEHTYPGMIACSKRQGLNMLGIKINEFGLSAEDLRLKLEAWDTARGLKPSALHTIPSGQNPRAQPRTTAGGELCIKSPGITTCTSSG